MPDVYIKNASSVKHYEYNACLDRLVVKNTQVLHSLNTFINNIRLLFASMSTLLITSYA